MGRIHAPETGAGPTVTKMGLRDGGFGGWCCGLCRFGLLPRVTACGPFLPFVLESGQAHRGKEKGADTWPHSASPKTEAVTARFFCVLYERGNRTLLPNELMKKPQLAVCGKTRFFKKISLVNGIIKQSRWKIHFIGGLYERRRRGEGPFSSP